MKKQSFSALLLSMSFYSLSSFAQVAPPASTTPQPAPLMYAAPSVNGTQPVKQVTPTTGQQTTGQVSQPVQPQNSYSTSTMPQGSPSAVPAAQSSVSTSDATPGKGLPLDVFNKMLNNQLPLSPEQIQSLHKSEDDIKRAHAKSARTMPDPISRSIQQSLSPGKNPNIIRMASNFPTTLVFTDSSGAPWPVQKIIVGNKDGIDVPELDGSSGAALKTPTNIITLILKDEYASNSVTFLLEGAKAPIFMMLATAQPFVDVRVDVSVSARGPNAVAPKIDGGTQPGISLPSAFSAFLDGTPPDGSQRLKSDNPEVEAWIYEDKMMLRTRLEVLSPYVFRKASSSDGTSVFEVAQASVVLCLRNGRTMSIGLDGFPPPNIEALRKATSR